MAADSPQAGLFGVPPYDNCATADFAVHPTTLAVPCPYPKKELELMNQEPFCSIFSATRLGDSPRLCNGCQRTKPAAFSQLARIAAIDPGRRGPGVCHRLSTAPARPPRLAPRVALSRHLLEHIRCPGLLLGSPRRWLVAGNCRRADVFRGGDDDPALPRDGPLRAGLSVRRLCLAALFYSLSVAAHRDLRRGDRHGAATRRPQGHLRHRHHRPVGRAGAHARLSRAWTLLEPTGADPGGRTTGRLRAGRAALDAVLHSLAQGPDSPRLHARFCTRLP